MNTRKFTFFSENDNPCLFMAYPSLSRTPPPDPPPDSMKRVWHGPLASRPGKAAQSLPGMLLPGAPWVRGCGSASGGLSF